MYLTDFGISRAGTGGETITDSGEVVGAADYVAPEQIAGCTGSTRSRAVPRSRSRSGAASG